MSLIALRSLYLLKII